MLTEEDRIKNKIASRRNYDNANMSKICVSYKRSFVDTFKNACNCYNLKISDIYRYIMNEIISIYTGSNVDDKLINDIKQYGTKDNKIALWLDSSSKSNRPQK